MCGMEPPFVSNQRSQGLKKSLKIEGSVSLLVTSLVAIKTSFILSEGIKTLAARPYGRWRISIVR